MAAGLFSKEAPLLIVSLALVGCGGAHSGAPAPTGTGPERAASVAPSAALAEFRDSGWAVIETRRFGLRVPLPEAGSWRIDDAATRWLRAEHGRTRSTLRVRIWPAARLARAADCEQQLQLWAPEIFRFEPAAERNVQHPPGYHGVLRLGVEQRQDLLVGHVVAIAATVGRCYAALYATEAAGAGAEEVLAARLAVIADAVLPRVELVSVDDRGHELRESR